MDVNELVVQRQMFNCSFKDKIFPARFLITPAITNPFWLSTLTLITNGEKAVNVIRKYNCIITTVIY